MVCIAPLLTPAFAHCSLRILCRLYEARLNADVLIILRKALRRIPPNKQLISSMAFTRPYSFQLCVGTAGIAGAEKSFSKTVVQALCSPTGGAALAAHTHHIAHILQHLVGSIEGAEPAHIECLLRLVLQRCSAVVKGTPIDDNNMRIIASVTLLVAKGSAVVDKTSYLRMVSAISGLVAFSCPVNSSILPGHNFRLLHAAYCALLRQMCPLIMPTDFDAGAKAHLLVSVREGLASCMKHVPWWQFEDALATLLTILRHGNLPAADAKQIVPECTKEVFQAFLRKIFCNRPERGHETPRSLLQLCTPLTIAGITASIIGGNATPQCSLLKCEVSAMFTFQA
jgi:hypothetical protein